MAKLMNFSTTSKAKDEKDLEEILEEMEAIIRSAWDHNNNPTIKVEFNFEGE